jgi:hypothetical protein
LTAAVLTLATRPGVPLAQRLYHFGEDSMTDTIFILVTVAFFAITAAYTRGCEKL